VPAGAWFESPLGLGAPVYANGFAKDGIPKCGEASLGFSHEVFLGKKIYYM